MESRELNLEKRLTLPPKRRLSLVRRHNGPAAEVGIPRAVFNANTVPEAPKSRPKIANIVDRLRKDETRPRRSARVFSDMRNLLETLRFQQLNIVPNGLLVKNWKSGEIVSGLDRRRVDSALIKHIRIERNLVIAELHHLPKLTVPNIK